jgi:lysosomal alpha-mannosidase
MNDEATTYYNDMIDQQTLGFKFILEEFGECARPRSAWYLIYLNLNKKVSK